MKHAHVVHLLFDYAAATLGPEERTAVEAHLQACASCQAALEQTHHLRASLDRLPQTIAPPYDLWAGIEARLHPRAPSPSGRSRPAQPRDERAPLQRAPGYRAGPRWKPGRRWALPALVLLLLAAGIGLWRLKAPPVAPAWGVIRLAGQPHIGDHAVTARGTLQKGEWLQTDRTSRAAIDVGDIGRVAVGPDTRVGVVDTDPHHNRLELSRGTIEAHIWAPPRLFFVETPSALAVDLGCAYTLSVDSTGGSLLAVSVGWVALEHGEREIVVPAGAMCRTRPGAGPGTPFDEHAAAALQSALIRFDFEDGGASALTTILEHAGPRDVITLWHLLVQTEGAARGRIYDRLATLAPPPAGVTRAGLLQNDPAMVERWQEHLGMDYEAWWAF